MDERPPAPHVTGHQPRRVVCYPLDSGSMNILVTGGAGYIGSVLVPCLLKAGHRVTVLDTFIFGQSSLTDCCGYDTFEVVRGDARDETVLEPLLKRADIIIPLAALVGAPMCQKDPIGTRTINQEAVEMLCRKAGRQQWILMPSTNSGYGFSDQSTVCTEETPQRPISLYGVTKVNAERAVLDLENSLSFRFATVFGMSSRMRIDLLVNDFVHRAVTDRAVVIFEGHFKRNYIHVQDVARVFLHAIDNFDAMRGRPYNAGRNDANLSKTELCAAIKEHLPQFVYLEAPIGEDPDKRDYVVSNARLAATGFETRWDLDRGIRELIKGYSILRNTRYTNV
jgi:nucleoside-diphosphate-sugar epimerase